MKEAELRGDDMIWSPGACFSLALCRFCCYLFCDACSFLSRRLARETEKVIEGKNEQRLVFTECLNESQRVGTWWILMMVTTIVFRMEQEDNFVTCYHLTLFPIHLIYWGSEEVEKEQGRKFSPLGGANSKILVAGPVSLFSSEWNEITF